MIVQCQNCQTKFNMSATILKKKGLKARCSRCGNVFVIYPPETIEAEDQPPVSVIQEKPGAETGRTETEYDKALDFKDSFEEDDMEDFEGLESEYQKDPLSFFEQTGVDILSEDTDRKSEENIEQQKERVPSGFDKKKNVKFYAPIILSIIILALIGLVFVVVDKYHPDLISGSMIFKKKPNNNQSTADMGANRLEILTVQGFFIDSEKAGRLFVIDGKVKNNYPNSRSFILVKGCILNEKGEIVKENRAFAGNRIGKDELKSLSVEEISVVMENRHGIDKNNVSVKPGTTLDFMIVFDGLPNNLSEYTVGAVSSSSGSENSEKST